MLEIRQTIQINSHKSTVWDYFSTQENLRLWFAPSIDIDLTVGGMHFHVSGEEEQLITGEVVHYNPMSKFAITWFEDGYESSWINPIRFTFTLEESKKFTEVVFVIDGFEQIGNADYHATYQAYLEGTIRHHILENLRTIVESYGYN